MFVKPHGIHCLCCYPKYYHTRAISLAPNAYAFFSLRRTFAFYKFLYHQIHTCLKLILASDLLDKLAEDVGLGGKLIKLGRGQTTLLEDTLQTGELLSSKTVALAKLVKDADVVLGVLVLGILLEALSSLLDLGSGIGKGGATNVLGDNLIENGEGASGGINTAAGGAVGTGLLVEEGNKGLLRTATVVVLGSGAALGEELDGGIRGHTIIVGGGLAVLSLGINLGNDDVGLVGEGGGKRLPSGGKALAVYGAELAFWF